MGGEGMGGEGMGGDVKGRGGKGRGGEGRERGPSSVPPAPNLRLHYWLAKVIIEHGIPLRSWKPLKPLGRHRQVPSIGLYLAY